MEKENGIHCCQHVKANQRMCVVGMAVPVRKKQLSPERKPWAQVECDRHAPPHLTAVYWLEVPTLVSLWTQVTHVSFRDERGEGTSAQLALEPNCELLTENTSTPPWGNLPRTSEWEKPKK